MTVPYFILLALAVMFGGLTHYYFYFYVAGLGLCVCIYQLYMRKVKHMFVTFLLKKSENTEVH